VRFGRTGWIADTTTCILGVAAILLAACGPTRAPDGVPLDERELIGAGDRIDQEIERGGLVFDDAVLARYLAETTARLKPGANHALRVRVIRQSTANAFALPNGSIWLTVSLLANVADESQLALVLGHEIAHLERRHPIAALRDRKRKKLMTQIAGLVAAPIGLADPIAGGLYAAVAAGYGREQEIEADRDGALAVAAAGYPVASLPAFFDIMDALGDAESGGLYADHPSNSARKAALQTLLAGRATGPANGSPADAFRAATRRVAVESVRLCLDWGKPARALTEADRQLALDPDNAVLHVLRGDAFRRLGVSDEHVTQALASYDRARALDPSLPEAHRGRGYMLLVRNEKPEARRELAEYLRLSPNAADRRFVQTLLDKELAP
jgi:predicted Zn-dependent protease